MIQHFCAPLYIFVLAYAHWKCHYKYKCTFDSSFIISISFHFGQVLNILLKSNPIFISTFQALDCTNWNESIHSLPFYQRQLIETNEFEHDYMFMSLPKHWYGVQAATNIFSKINAFILFSLFSSFQYYRIYTFHLNRYLLCKIYMHSA